MKAKIKSYYYYNNLADCSGSQCAPLQYDDCSEEELEAEIKKEENKLMITHSKGYIVIEYNKITQIYNGNEMIIEVGKTTECTYNTEYGEIKLKITCISVEKNIFSKKICEISYTMEANESKPYMVRIELFEE